MPRKADTAKLEKPNLKLKTLNLKPYTDKWEPESLTSEVLRRWNSLKSQNCTIKQRASDFQTCWERSTSQNSKTLTSSFKPWVNKLYTDKLVPESFTSEAFIEELKYTKSWNCNLEQRASEFETCQEKLTPQILRNLTLSLKHWT